MSDGGSSTFSLADLDNLGKELRNELAIAVRDLKIWAGSIAVIIAGFLFGALHQWPPQPTPPAAAGSLSPSAR